MALTSDSFRDPRKLYKVKVKSPFWITGREKPTEVGEVVALPRSDAAEVIHSNKAEPHVEGDMAPSTSPIKRADPPQMPKSTTDAKASKETAK
jgi:hypothetical protein